jgi:hypothetical protein
MTDDEFKEAIRRVRKGDGVKVPTLASIAPDMKKLRERLDKLHARGNYVVDAQGRRSDTPAVAGMILDAADVLRKGPPPIVSRTNGAKSPGAPRKVREMPPDRAEQIWTNVRKYRTNAEALKAMPGWTMAAAHRYFGKSGRASPGRPRTRKKT